MTGAGALRFLTFRVDQRLYALPAEEVSQVIRVPSVARVPRAPLALLGLANFRGSIIPIASLRGLLGVGEADGFSASRAIVLNRAAPVAIAVELGRRVCRDPHRRPGDASHRVGGGNRRVFEGRIPG